MKKSLGLFAVLLLLLVAVVGCGSSNKDLSLEKFIKAYQDAGIEVDSDKKPMFQMIDAKDGVIFDFDKQKVAIYEYASKKEAEKVKSESGDLMKDWPQNEAFILETSNEKAIEIFNSVE